jgi:TonB-linked SusC/RagA family outer membrane protein
MKRKTQLILLLLLACLQWSFAQDRTVSGTVTDSEGLPLIGATVQVGGTSTGTATDAEGKFTLTVPSTTEALIVSYTGYVTQEIPLGVSNVMDIRLQEDVTSLDEVVVIGYGERRKKDLTGSISTVNSEDIERIPFASPEFALQGNTTGVRVVNSSGDPSDGPSIFVRGIGTFNGESQPLYVIDGQIISPPTAVNRDLIGNINLWTLINPNDIESISVLKDASAAAIYGSRAANGVILITTKKGKKGRPKVELSVQTGIQNIPTFDVLNVDQFVELGRELYTNSLNPDVTLEQDLYGREEPNDGTRLNNFSPQYDPNSPYYLGNSQTYNWADHLLNKNALTQNYNVKVSGASDAANYFVSIGYIDQESSIIGDDLERFNLTSNLTADIGDFMSVGLTYRAAYQTAFSEGPTDLVGAAEVPPWQPLFDPTGPLGYALPFDNYFGGGGWNQTRLYGTGTRSNYLGSIDLNDSRFELLRSVGQGYIEIKPVAGLNIRGGLSIDYIYQQRRNFSNIDASVFNINSPDPASLGTGNSFGNLGFRTNKFINYQADLMATYTKSFGNHNFSLLVGAQDQFYKRFNEDISTDNLSTNDFDRLFIPNDRPQVAGFSGRDQKFWFGYVGRMSYNYNSRYYLDVSYRRDASAGFPKENRWGNFYSVSGAWRVSSEPFMARAEWLDDLKIRGGWGQAGNDEAVAGAYAYLSGVNEQGSYGLGSGNGNATGNYNVGVALNDLPNRDITWETVVTTYIGFDALMFNNKINATVEFFDRTTEDILQQVNLPLTVGVNDPFYNVGSVKNTGVDLLLGYNNKVGAFTYSISGNISFIKNEVLELYNDQPLTTFVFNSDVGGGFGRLEEGRSIGHIWGYQLGGIFQNQAEIDAYFDNTPDETIGDASYVAPGDMYFVDVYGNPTETEPFYSTTPDGVINAFDQTEIGKTIPSYTYGLNISGEFKGVDLNLNFYGEGDVDKVAEWRFVLQNLSGAGTNRSVTVLDRWTPSNPSTTLPRAVVGDPAGNQRLSTRFVESAAFFRLNTWQLGYSIPATLLARTNVFSRFRIYVGGQNNIYLHNWSGVDPVNDRYPLPRSYFLGLNVNF